MPIESNYSVPFIDYLAKFGDYVGRLTANAASTTAAYEANLGADYPAVSRPEQVSDWERRFYSDLYQAGLRSIPQFTVEQFDLDFAIVVGNQRSIELGWDVKRFWVYEIRDRLPQCVRQVQDWVVAAESHRPAMDDSSIEDGVYREDPKLPA